MKIKSSFLFYFFLLLVLVGLLIIFITPSHTEQCSEDLVMCLQSGTDQGWFGKILSNLGCVLSNFGCVMRSFGEVYFKWRVKTF